MKRPARQSAKIHLTSSAPLLKGLAVLVVLLCGVVGVHLLGSSSAATYDSSLTIQIVGYSGSVGVTTDAHSIGTCSSSAGQIVYVSGSRTCQGSAFGPMSLFVQQLDYHYGVSGYSSSNSSKVSCYSGGCSVNYISGSATITIYIKSRASAPTAPGLYVNSVSRTSVNLTWSGGNDNYGTNVGYRLYMNGAAYSSYGENYPQNVTIDNLHCGTSYRFYVEMYNNIGSDVSNTVIPKTSSCPTSPSPSPTPTPTPTPAPTPSPTPTPTPTPSPSPTPRQTPIQGPSPIYRTTPPSESPAPTLTRPTNKPPAVPRNFQAAPDDGSSVYLSWDSDVAVASYKLERSTDQKHWETLSEAITDNYYFDTKTTFATRFYYRLTATGLNNLVSKPAAAQVLTNPFKSNAGNGSDLTLTSDDGVLTVVIPSAALTQPASCQFASSPTLPLFSIKDFRAANGPYQIICQNADNSFVDSFEQDLDAVLQLDKAPQAKFDAYTLAGYDNTSQGWQQFAVPSGQQAPHISFKLAKQYMGLSVYGKPHHTPFWVGLLWTLLILIVLAIATLLGLRQYLRVRTRRQYEAVTEDYWRKEHGL